MGVANSEAELLHEAIDKKQLDHDHVMWILSTRNVFHLRETFQCYKQKFGNPIEEVSFPHIWSKLSMPSLFILLQV